ncbi:MAG: hypothetical protein EXX96DRAFT_543557 [Benjaminiella poitrasii]|nr:MAG: hypothetical protein EXX96DRAFT_543557 [Benjaminiella poitrasii]
MPLFRLDDPFDDWLILGVIFKRVAKVKVGFASSLLYRTFEYLLLLHIEGPPFDFVEAICGSPFAVVVLSSVGDGLQFVRPKTLPGFLPDFTTSEDLVEGSVEYVFIQYFGVVFDELMGVGTGARVIGGGGVDVIEQEMQVGDDFRVVDVLSNGIDVLFGGGGVFEFVGSPFVALEWGFFNGSSGFIHIKVEVYHFVIADTQVDSDIHGSMGRFKSRKEIVDNTSFSSVVFESNVGRDTLLAEGAIEVVEVMMLDPSHNSGAARVPS